MQRGPRPLRRTDRIDVAASVLVRVAPRALEPVIDRLRLDARSIVDGLMGVREPSFSTSTRPALAPRALRDIDPVLELLPRSFRRTYSTLRRDVEMVARDLRGDRVPPTIARAPRPAVVGVRAGARHASLTPRPMRVRAVERETEDAVSLVLEPIDGGPLAFTAGQFLTLHLRIDGELVKRAYSLSSAPSDGALRVTCKRIANGRASTFVNERLRAGDVVEVLGPSGSFVVPRDAGPIVLVAGGSGITPCWSIARTVLARDADARVTLVYGNRAERDVIFADAIGALAAAEPERFRVVHVLSDPEHAHEGPRGLLDRATFGALADGLDLGAHFFVCGPAPMMDEIRAALGAIGVSTDRIHEERFHTPARTTEVARAPQLVTVRRRGRTHAVTVPPTRTLLEAAMEAGVAMPFSCAIGGCAACRCKVIEGHVEMDEPNCLTPEERAEGWVLTCVGRPTRTTTLEVP